MEREFDRMIKIATPYLIFSPNDVRDVVADYMKSLWRAMRNNNTTEFDTLCMRINEVIATSDDLTDSTLQIDISDFDSRWSNLDESISKLRKELIELKKEVSNISKEKAVKRLNNEMIKEEEVPMEVLDATNIEIAKLPMKRENRICSCGNNLTRKRNKNGIYTLYCFKSKGGCGKVYFTTDDGELIEKKSVKQNKVICISCGGKMDKQGKVKSNGKEYQRYACKPATEGGCGKGYTMDDDGDLHLGRSKSALSTPKIQPWGSQS